MSDKECFCTFCGKSSKNVEALIAGPGVYICNECVVICHKILEEKRAEKEAERNIRKASFMEYWGTDV